MGRAYARGHLLQCGRRRCGEAGLSRSTRPSCCMGGCLAGRVSHSGLLAVGAVPDLLRGRVEGHSFAAQGTPGLHRLQADEGRAVCVDPATPSCMACAGTRGTPSLPAAAHSLWTRCSSAPLRRPCAGHSRYTCVASSLGAPQDGHCQPSARLLWRTTVQSLWVRHLACHLRSYDDPSSVRYQALPLWANAR